MAVLKDRHAMEGDYLTDAPRCAHLLHQLQDILQSIYDTRQQTIRAALDKLEGQKGLDYSAAHDGHQSSYNKYCDWDTFHAHINGLIENWKSAVKDYNNQIREEEVALLQRSLDAWWAAYWAEEAARVERNRLNIIGTVGKFVTHGLDELLDPVLPGDGLIADEAGPLVPRPRQPDSLRPPSYEPNAVFVYYERISTDPRVGLEDHYRTTPLR